MVDATKLVSRAASEAVQDIAELYKGYHAELVRKFVMIMREQHNEPSERTRRRRIEEIVKGFANEVKQRQGDVT